MILQPSFHLKTRPALINDHLRSFIIYQKVMFAIFQGRNISEMFPLLTCHNCKPWPCTVADFDLILHDVPTQGIDHIHFTGGLKVGFNASDMLMEVNVNLYPVRFATILNTKAKVQKLDCYLHLTEVIC